MSSADSNSTNVPDLSRDQALALLNNQQEQLTAQQQTIDQLQHQLDWFKRELFGEKSERRVIQNQNQLALALGEKAPATPVEPETKTITYQRGKAKKRRDEDCVSDSGLRFGPDVPMETVRLPIPGVDTQTGETLEVIGREEFYRLAQRPGSYVVIRYERPVLKNVVTGDIARVDSPSGVFDKSLADVSFLVGMLVDKFQYHIPLYRQHQRLESSGITLSRATLTNLVRRSIALLEPIADAQLQHILLSRVLAMDETPIKAGKSKTRKGKLNTGYYWPVFGEENEISFVYADGRAHRHVQNIISKDFEGVIVSDGYAAYAQYAAARDNVTNAQCWSHTRRYFVRAEQDEPDKAAHVIASIRSLYTVEKQLRSSELEGEEKLAYRVEHSKPAVELLLAFVEKELGQEGLLPKSPYAKALNYLYKRREALQVFLSDPDVPLDTNHVERPIRKIAMGRRSWLFCWTELGAKQVGIIQSLVSTCLLHQVNPYEYLVDVLQRVQIQPNNKLYELTPREWKVHFSEHPLKSDLSLIV